LVAGGNSDSPRERENVPKMPEKKPGQPGPQPGEKLPASDGIPSNPGPDPAGDSLNKLGAPPPNSKTARVATPDANDRWGDLPIQAREVFRTEGGADLPPQYRDWIDAYYKKLQGLK
jgi:hypothetical protein